MKIYGAGIAGLLAGCAFQTAKIYEAGSEGSTQHKAVLRFRSSIVGDSVGIPFRKVKVHKGIWHNGKFAQPSIQLSNLYSMKVIGRLADRSIWNLDTVERFIAPEDFISQLADRCSNRIIWNHKVTASDVEEIEEPIISTLPMPVMSKIIKQIDPFAFPILEVPEFSYAPIVVKRWRIPDADVFQTIYFPSEFTSLYRVSITGDLLIAEYAEEADDYDFFGAFGLSQVACEPIETTKQGFGKIASVNDAWRKKFIFDLTSKYQIYSLGRFGTWRNLLLDDVINDISVLKKLMNTSAYDRNKINAK